MQRRRGRYPGLLAVLGLVCGVALGLGYGWAIDPVEYVDTDVAYLHPTYRNEFILMVGEAYAMDGDLDVARARLALLSLPDPASAVADLADRTIAQNGPLSQIRALAGLAGALGAERDSLRPYQSPADGAP